jgi:hypothetical protein
VITDSLCIIVLYPVLFVRFFSETRLIGEHSREIQEIVLGEHFLCHHVRFISE